MKWFGLCQAPPWLNRTAWLALWTIWLWLGFGLYRELPRDLGPKVCKLELRGGERLWAFAPEGAVLIARTWDRSTRRDTFSAYDAHSGKRIGDIATPPRSEEGSQQEILSQSRQATNDPWNVYLPER